MTSIPGFLDYFADVYGGIYSKKPWGGGLYAAVPTTLRKLVPVRDDMGYNRVTLYRDKQGYPRRVGRFILETFVGPCPTGMVMCHGQKGKLVDSLDNLSWGTRSKNQGEDRLRDGTDSRGEKQGNSKLTSAQVLEMLTHESIMSRRAWARKFGVCHSTINKIFNRQTWAWLKKEKV